MTKVLLTTFCGELILAGGAPRYYLTKDDKYEWKGPNDVDFFFVGVSELRANEILKASIRILSTGECVTIMRNEYVTTITKNSKKYQFIHRIYPKLDLVIGGFDLANCAVAYDGVELYTTPLACFSIVNRLEIINVSRRSTSYEYRLRKYYQRYGLRIVFPGTSLEAIIKRDHFFSCKYSTYNLPYISLQKKSDYQNNNNTVICLSSCRKPNGNGKQQESDYEDNLSDAEWVVGKGNCKMAIRGNLGAIHVYASSVGEAFGEDCRVPGKNYLFDPQKLLRTFQNADVKMIKSWFPKRAAKIAKAMADKDMEKLSILCVEISMVALKNLGKAKNKLKTVTWRINNPGTQWTSSINPIIKDPRDWYGKEIYTSFRILIPENVETCFRMFRLKKEGRDSNLFQLLPKDIFKLFLEYVAYAYAACGYNIAIGISNSSNFILPRSSIKKIVKPKEKISEIRLTNVVGKLKDNIRLFEVIEKVLYNY